MIPALLVLLALVDGALLGFRSAAGRIGTINKRSSYQRAVLLGLISAAVLSLGGVAIALLLSALQGPTLWPALENAGLTAIYVFAVFAVLVLSALVIWFVPVLELRTLATVTILGPGTLLRPLIIVGGMTAGFVRNPRWEVALLGAYGALSMLLLEPWLTRTFFPIDERLFTTATKNSNE